MDNHLICIAPINWDDVWEGPQEISCRFAASGWKVLFVENLGGRVPRPTWQDGKRIAQRVLRLAARTKPAAPANVTVHTPLNFPPYAVPWLEKRNLRALTSQLRNHLRRAGCDRPVIWTYHPSPLVRKLCVALDPKLLIYCCINDYGDMSSGNGSALETENEMIRTADLVFVVPHQLLLAKRRFNSNTYPMPQGANLSDYMAYTPVRDDPTELRCLPRPIFGYVGTIHEWVDQNLLKYAAAARPQWSFVLVGPQRVGTKKLKELPNVSMLGYRPHSRLPHYVSQFDVGIIPYLTYGQGRTFRPNKALEYLVMGKPVVSTYLPELANLAPHVLMAKSAPQFVEAMDCALTLTSAAHQEQRRELAVRESLDHKFSTVEQLILKHLDSRPLPACV